MTRLLQSFDFRRSPYERPNQKWVCGHTDAPCQAGPDQRGRCRATAECRPRADGNHWVCTRGKDSGGACADGPRPDGSCARPIPPCQPVRSLRAKRGLVTRWATVVALGLAVVMLAGGNRDAAVSPGPLTAEHAEVAGCAGCHDAGDAGPAEITRAALDGVADAHDGDSQACLSCHQVGDTPFKPHSADALPPAPADTDPDAPQLSPPYLLNFASQSFPEPDATGRGTACATCHTEHQGAAADITAMSDARCQACHTRKFAAFNAGHPEFGDYPYDRRTRLNFDHVAHAGKYFADADAPGPETCTACHTRDAQSGLMATKGFAETCAACHAGEIRGQAIAGSPGVPVISVPGLDVLTLQERGVAIGQWPELAEAELTPFIRALLAGRNGVESDTLGRFEELDTLDLRGASADDLQVVKRVAWAFKRLVYDLTAHGPQKVAPALQGQLQRSLSDAVVRDLLGGLPQDTVRAAQRNWFPDLATELARRDAGQQVPIPGSQQDTPDEPTAATDQSSASADDDGDLLGGDGQSGQGTGGGLLGGDGADAGGASDGDLLAGDGGADAADDDGGLLADDAGGADDGDLLGAGEGGAEGQDSAGGLVADDGSSEDGGGLLGGDDGTGSGSGSGADDGGLIAGDDTGGDDTGGDADGGGLLGSSGDSGDDSGGDLLGGAESEGGDGGLLAEQSAGSSQEAAEKTAEREIAAEMPDPIPSEWTALGGWYRDFYVLSYRPRDHDDAFLRRWLETTAPRGGGNGALAEVFARLSDPKAPGRCAKCHSIDARDAGGFQVNWQAGTTITSGSRLTGFRHGPHLTLTSGREGCATCHRFDRDAAYPASFDDRDPTTFDSNFAAIDKATCATCHTPEEAGASCTRCHTYHAQEPHSQAVGTRMRDKEMTR
jgi:hypothetical protein